ncbi:MAG: hypothetical protein AB7P46_08950 [Thermoanaerobaculia bacterium]
MRQESLAPLPLVVLVTLLAASAIRAQPISVSPGVPGRVVEIELRCPTFSWAATKGASGYEFILFRLPAESDRDRAEPVLALRKAFAEGVTGWTPPLEECPERGGLYAWVVRTLDTDRAEPVASTWSEPRLFRVSRLPALSEVDQALEVLRTYREASADSRPFTVDSRPATRTSPPAVDVDPADQAGAFRMPAEFVGAGSPDTVALRGDVPGLSGYNVGVYGTSASPGDFSAGVVGESTAAAGFTFGILGVSSASGGVGVGAISSDPTGGVGLFARNEGTAGAAIDAEADADTGNADGILARANAPGGAALRAAHRESTGGADIVLDGSQQFVTDTILTESGLSRSSANPETFSFSNLGGGALTLDIDGVEVITTATDQDTLADLVCAEGEIAKLSSGSWVCSTDTGTTYSAGNQLQLSDTTFDVLEGSGSGLDADSIDGLDSAQLAPAVHTHDGADIVPGTLGTAALANGAVTGLKILDHSISLDDLPGDSTCPPGTYLHKYQDSLGGWQCEPFQTLADLLQIYYPPEPPSLFGKFGGYPNAGDVVISGPQIYSGVRNVQSLTIQAGGAAIVDTGFLYVGAQGRCTIQGSIVAGGFVLGAPNVVAAGPAIGKPGRRANFVEAGYGMVGSLAALPVDLAVSGAGGGGGGANGGGGAATSRLSRGGDGGGAVGAGGAGGCVGCGSLAGGNAAANNEKRSRLTGGEFAGHPVRTDNFSTLLLFPGASGGAGAVGAGGGTSGGGGNGGGVVYLECNELEFTGSIDVSGDGGTSGSGDAGGGGGGGGGVALIRYRTLIGTLTGTINLTGGPGGNGAGTGGAGGAGGFGFAGVEGFP